MAKTKPSARLDVRRFLLALGGVARLRKKWIILGLEEVPSEVQMRKWVQRKIIPTNWLLVMLVQAKAEGRALDLTSYVTYS